MALDPAELCPCEPCKDGLRARGQPTYVGGGVGFAGFHLHVEDAHIFQVAGAPAPSSNRAVA